MTDGNSLASALTSAKVALDILKLVRESGSSLKTAELQLKLADAVVALSSLRTDLADLQDELRAKDEKIRELDEAFELRDKVVRIHDAYYRVGADGSHHGSAYCLRCWENDRKLRGLTRAIANKNQCTACRTLYDATRSGTFA